MPRAHRCSTASSPTSVCPRWHGCGTGASGIRWTLPPHSSPPVPSTRSTAECRSRSTGSSTRSSGRPKSSGSTTWATSMRRRRCGRGSDERARARWPWTPTRAAPRSRIPRVRSCAAGSCTIASCSATGRPRGTSTADSNGSSARPSRSTRCSVATPPTRCSDCGADCWGRRTESPTPHSSCSTRARSTWRGSPSVPRTWPATSSGTCRSSTPPGSTPAPNGCSVRRSRTSTWPSTPPSAGCSTRCRPAVT